MTDNTQIVFFTNDEKRWIMDGHDLIDPACYTNSSCGIPIITTAIELVTLRYFILRIGCKFFPEVYPVSNCEVTISGSGTLKVNATLVNLRETTCNGSELVVDTPSSDGTINAVVYTENALTVS
ncbi:hypothetical protein FHG87_020824 [Trinorchestia longiramus]|nr:hypothetical protein FHG87_020824 [Trinorchestia longiramus]